MSINATTLLANGSTVPFPLSVNESLTYSTPTSRQSLNITLTDGGKVHITAKDGHIYLTNKRLVYVTGSQGDIETFAVDLFFAPVIQFSHKLKSPWFGANYWEFLFYSSTVANACDGFPPNTWFKGLIQFNDGGVFDFVDIFGKVLNDVVNNKDIDDELPQYSAQ